MLNRPQLHAKKAEKGNELILRNNATDERTDGQADSQVHQVEYT